MHWSGFLIQKGGFSKQLIISFFTIGTNQMKQIVRTRWLLLDSWSYDSPPVTFLTNICICNIFLKLKKNLNLLNVVNIRLGFILLFQVWIYFFCLSLFFFLSHPHSLSLSLLFMSLVSFFFLIIILSFSLCIYFSFFFLSLFLFPFYSFIFFLFSFFFLLSLYLYFLYFFQKVSSHTWSLIRQFTRLHQKQTKGPKRWHFGGGWEIKL